MTTSNFAVGYFRANDESSIDHQRHEALAYCERKGLTLVDEYVDVAYSAISDKRPTFQKLMRDAQCNPAWHIVLVSDFSRFSRNMINSFKYRNLLTDNDITLICINQDYSTSYEESMLNISELISKISTGNATPVKNR
ncbi:MAG: recombinase family protein [Oscillospiraceae bacterium]|nr:recombinase family protein [Oscillospiraceae bacterium]